MAEAATKERPSVKQVAEIIRRMSREELAELVRLVPDLQEVKLQEEKPAPARKWDEAELREYFKKKLEELGGEARPMRDDDPFLGGLTVGEFFALPDEEQEAIWAHEPPPTLGWLSPGVQSTRSRLQRRSRSHHSRHRCARASTKSS